MHYGFSEKQWKLFSSLLDSQFIDERRKAKTALSYVTHSYIEEMLDYAFDGCWSYEIVDHWSESAVVINKYSKTDENGYPIPQQDKTIMHVICKLIVPMYPQPDYDGEIIPDDIKNKPVWITKMGAGSAVGDGSADVQKDKYKSASMDALKKAATLLGAARELYTDNEDEEQGDLAKFAQWVATVIRPENWSPHDNFIYAKELEQINTIYSYYSVNEDDQQQLMQMFFEETNDMYGMITPKNIKKYITWLHKQIEFMLQSDTENTENTGGNNNESGIYNEGHDVPMPRMRAR